MYRDWVTRGMATEMSSFSTLLFKISIMPRSFVIQSYLLVVGILQEKLIESHSSMLSGKQAGPSVSLGRILGKLIWNSHFVAVLTEITLQGKLARVLNIDLFFKKICFQEKKYTCMYCFHSTVISFINTFSLG